MTLHQVFAYGDLARKSTILRVLGREPIMIEAVLPGHDRVLDPEIDHEVVIPKDGASVQGKLLIGLTERELLTLDEFQGATARLYERAMVESQVHGGTARAHLYVRRL